MDLEEVDPSEVSTVVADRPASLDVPTLCRAWRASSHALSAATEPGARADLVLARALLLDAMSARDPAGVTAWLSADEPARHDPRRLLRDDRRRLSRRRWGGGRRRA